MLPGRPRPAGGGLGAIPPSWIPMDVCSGTALRPSGREPHMVRALSSPLAVPCWDETSRQHPPRGVIHTLLAHKSRKVDLGKNLPASSATCL